MTKKEKLINRLNKAFDLDFNDKTPIITRMNNRNGGFSWIAGVGGSSVGSANSITECLTWEKWVLSTELHELLEYHENDIYDSSCRIEKI